MIDKINYKGEERIAIILPDIYKTTDDASSLVDALF